VILRASAGRFGDERALELDEGELVDRLRADLGTTMGLDGEPTEVRVTRWPSSFPQYVPGHLQRVARIEDAVAAEAPGIIVTGAAFRGVGLPACIRQGREAAAQLAGGPTEK
jgi:oxygen-dependent protoporphyrinogen oxidase